MFSFAAVRFGRVQVRTFDSADSALDSAAWLDITATAAVRAPGIVDATGAVVFDQAQILTHGREHFSEYLDADLH